MAEQEFKKLEDVVAEILNRLGGQLLEQELGMMVFVFDVGQRQRGLAYGSTCRREDTVTALVEFLGKQEPAILRQAVERWNAQGVLGPGSELVQ